MIIVDTAPRTRKWFPFQGNPSPFSFLACDAAIEFHAYTSVSFSGIGTSSSDHAFSTLSTYP